MRQYLIDHDLVDHIWVILTTAGMPYRIQDTALPEVVYPAGSSAAVVQQNQTLVDAASVESELAVLFQIDPALEQSERAPLAARIVNPYHGYISSFEQFCQARDILGRRDQFDFRAPLAAQEVVYEGSQWTFWRASGGRQFSAGDIYLVARLDGPRTSGTLPLAAIRRMLESAARAGDPTHQWFRGYDPELSVAAIDDSDGPNLDLNRWLNAGSSLALMAPPDQYLQAQYYPNPPDAETDGPARDDLRYACRSLAGFQDLPDLGGTELVVAPMADYSLGGTVVYDPTGLVLAQAALAPGSAVAALATFGVNAGDGRGPDYLLTGGPGGSRLIEPAYGAVFSSLESFNAVTFFLDAATGQAKVADWLAIGGAGAVGYAFEPVASSAADADLLLFNYLRDADGDGVSDMSFVEAAYTAMPFLSWATVVVGDPLMRLRHAPAGGGSTVAIPPIVGDGNWDGYVSMSDYMLWWCSYGSGVGEARYDERADFNQDGWVTTFDFLLWAMNYGTSWQQQSAEQQSATLDQPSQLSWRRPGRAGLGLDRRGQDRPRPLWRHLSGAKP